MFFFEEKNSKIPLINEGFGLTATRTHNDVEGALQTNRRERLLDEESDEEQPCQINCHSSGKIHTQKR